MAIVKSRTSTAPLSSLADLGAHHNRGRGLGLTALRHSAWFGEAGLSVVGW
ncbi:hypothetical protein HMPREF9153_0798 [Cutibacterium avidum ATCC 25577]|uniref:Uncharacterized protein n=1 Tax=Cutibacterium avidum ATCC 25577 TaxID=997355 RepID=G4CW91_9ACTN|nr:hypothetical protein HMPREF9153_0798 [Cutibacterium avidum ATCC 25577]